MPAGSKLTLAPLLCGPEQGRGPPRAAQTFEIEPNSWDHGIDVAGVIR
jgi:hypothetical protein